MPSASRSARPIKVLIVEGSIVSRLMVESILSASADFRVVGAVGPEKLIPAVDHLRPDLVVVDICTSLNNPVLTALRDYGAVKKVAICAEPLPEQVRGRLTELGVAGCYEKRLIADDHEGFRTHLRRLLAAEAPPHGAGDPTGSEAADDSKREGNAAGRSSGTEARHAGVVSLSPPNARLPFKVEEEAEAARLEVLAALEIANSNADHRLDLITKHLCRVTDYPMAAITLIDESVQWVKAASGLERMRMPRSEAICDHTIASAAPLIVGDTREHPIFSHFPCVTGGPGIRAYVGMPLLIDREWPIGAICLLDTRPRITVQREIPLLLDMAKLVVAMLDGPAPRLAA